MKKAKHTPGPWTFEETKSGIWIEGPKPSDQVAIICKKSQSIENAILIAASPDMLKALESIDKSLDWIVEQETPDKEMIDLLRADHGKIKSAIAKAKGGKS